MPAIDGLLRLIEAQKAEGLVLNTHKPPALLHSGRPQLLSMPPLTPALIETIVSEVLSEEERQSLTSTGMVETTYEGEKVGSYSTRVRVSTDKLVLTFRPLTPRPPRRTGNAARQQEGALRLSSVPESVDRAQANRSDSGTWEVGSILETPAVGERVEERPGDNTSRASAAERTTEKPLERTWERDSERTIERLPDKSPDRSGDRIIERPSDRTLERPSERSHEIAHEKGPEKGTEPPWAAASDQRRLHRSGLIDSLQSLEHASDPAPLTAPIGLPLYPTTPAAAQHPPRNLLRMLELTLENRASDLLLPVGGQAAMRAGGEWTELPSPPIQAEDLLALFSQVLTPRHREILLRTGSTDLAYVLLHERGSRRFRVNLFYQLSGLCAALRPIWDDVPTLAQLNLPDSLKHLVDPPHGLVLVTGPAGSGKSTTLTSLIDHLNRTRACHVVTLEDPIEFVHPRRKAIIHQREIGAHVESFATGLRAALREAPDVLLVGELRDLETISAAITAAETGHLVLATLHAGSAAMAIDRLIDVFPEHQQSQVRLQLSGVLRSVMTQRLLPGTRPTSRYPALEILHVNHAVAHLIRDRRVFQIPSQIQIGREDGMLSLEHSLVELVRTGRISRETASKATSDLSQLREWTKDRAER